MKVLLSLLSIFFITCLVFDAPMAAQSPGKKQPAPISKAPPPSTENDPDSITGTVLETMDAAGYTYLRLKTPKGEIWAAVQKANI